MGSSNKQQQQQETHLLHGQYMLIFCEKENIHNISFYYMLFSRLLKYNSKKLSEYNFTVAELFLADKLNKYH